MLILHSAVKGTTFHVEEDSVLCEVLLNEGFIPVDNSEPKEKAEKGIPDISDNIDIMSKQELIELAELLGIEVKARDTVNVLIKKIKKVRGEK